MNGSGSLRGALEGSISVPARREKRRTRRYTGRKDLSVPSGGDDSCLLWFLTTGGIVILSPPRWTSVRSEGGLSQHNEQALVWLVLVRKLKGMTDGGKKSVE